MIELKVQCDCGQKYKFDVEPINGRMPFTVNCPVCGVDGTDKANALLQQVLMQKIAQPSSLPPQEQPKLRISNSTYTPSSLVSPTISPVTAESSPAPRPLTGLARPLSAVTSEKNGKNPSFAMGLLGGLIGALIGATIYFFIFKYSGLQFKLLALGVGGLAGWGAELLGKGEGSKELGGITAVFVLASIIAAQYFVALSSWHKGLAIGISDSAYAVSVREAKQAVRAIPTGSDVEIRNYLAKAVVEDGDKPNPNSISDGEVKQFREKNLPELYDLASGKITEEQYDTKNGIDPAQQQKEKNSEEDTFKGVFLLLLVSRINIFSLAAAAALAFKMSTNA
jgi:hypothetical protein